MGQADFASAIGVGRQAYSSWEASLEDIQPRNIVAIARQIELLTGVPATWVLGLEETAASATEGDAAAAAVTLRADAEKCC